MALVVDALEAAESDGAWEASFRIAAGAGSERVWFRLPGELAPPSPDALGACATAAALPVAMQLGEPLEIRAEVCDRLRAGLDRFQEVFATFDWRLHRVPVQVERWIGKPGARAPGVAAFVSGGLDSFYTALTHPDIELLVFVRGADIALGEEDDLWSEARGRLSTAATALGKRLVTIETNVKALGDAHMHWGFYHGAALCGIGHLLSGAVGRLFVAASFSYRNLPAWGSHPLLDPAWSTSRLEIVHDGCERSRIDKAAVVGRSDAAMQALRVCLENRDGRYNCGVCAKCLRTLVNFRNAGLLDRCRTFDQPLDLTRVRRCGPRTEIERIFLVENLHAAQARGDDPELLRALKIALEGDGSRLRRRARRVEHKIRRLGKRVGLAG